MKGCQTMQRIKFFMGILLIITAPVILITFWVEISHWFTTPYGQYNAVFLPLIYFIIAIPLGFALIGDSIKKLNDSDEKKAEKISKNTSLLKEMLDDFDAALDSIK